MEDQNNNKGVIALLIVIIVILAVLCVLFATGTIGFKSNEVANNTSDNINNNTSNNTSNETTNNNQKNNNYDTWMNYILEQNITNVNIDRSRDDDNPAGEYHIKVNLTTEQLKNVFSKLMNYNLVKRYLEGSGFTYGDILTISYSINGTNYDVKIANGELWADSVSLKDVNLLNALENSNHTVENEDIKNMEGAFFNYRFQGYNESILDEFFK